MNFAKSHLRIFCKNLILSRKIRYGFFIQTDKGKKIIDLEFLGLELEFYFLIGLFKTSSHRMGDKTIKATDW